MTDMLPTDLDQIIRLQADVKRLTTALRAAAQAFRSYEALHAAKESLDGDAKAWRNRELAKMCEAALPGGK